jgi:hypothetical protein
MPDSSADSVLSISYVETHIVNELSFHSENQFCVTVMAQFL